MLNNQFGMFDPAKDKKTGLALFQRDTPIAWAGRKFDALPAESRDFFMDIKLKAVFVETENPNEIRNLFIRLDLLDGNYAHGWEKEFSRAFHAFSKKLSEAKKDKDRQDSYWINYGIIIGQSAGSKSTIEAVHH
jgi:hypothetical protein